MSRSSMWSAASVMVASLTAAIMACSGAIETGGDALRSADNAETAEVGHPAPDLSIQTVNNRGVLALDNHSGKIVVVDFWATWCEPCKRSFPELELLSRRHRGKVEVIGVSADDDPDGIADFAKTLGTTFGIGWDKGHAIASRWRVQTMPTSFVVDTSGTIRFVHAGFHDGDGAKLYHEVETLLADSTERDTKSPPPPASPQAGAPEQPPTEEAATASPPPEVKSKPTTKTKKKSPRRKPSKSPPPGRS
jgi:thiol-disulfide isomerase/thioredoxin